MIDDQDEDEEDVEEVEITIEPRDSDLEALGVDRDEFEAALLTALDALEQTLDPENPDTTVPIEDTKIHLGGQVVLLREVADIAITKGFGVESDGDEADDLDDRAD